MDTVVGFPVGVEYLYVNLGMFITEKSSLPTGPHLSGRKEEGTTRSDALETLCVPPSFHETGDIGKQDLS